MGKKKREHIVFDQMLKQKKSIPFSKVNTGGTKKKQKYDEYTYEQIADKLDVCGKYSGERK